MNPASLRRRWRFMVPLAAAAALCFGWAILFRPAAGGGTPAPAAAPETQPARVVKVLYVEGAPRWEYRYLKNAMLRRPSVRISCLLTSADAGVVQDASPADPKINFPGPVQRFPESAEELAPFDVLLLGDVDPRLLTDRQLKIVADFVRKDGGGLGMVAGPRFAPSSYRKTPLAELLPVNVEKAEPDGKDDQFHDGFQPALTEAGRSSPIFRAWRERQASGAGKDREEQTALYWYCRGVTARPAAEAAAVLATHPTAKAADGSPVPLLVVGRGGKGRTLFSGIDDSWRWRFASDDQVFVAYWVEQLRYLAGGRGGG